MLQIPSAHKEKIDKAISVCEKAFVDFSGALEKAYGKKESSTYKYFILQNTIFAGGLFRSIFTETPINDIDIFFTSEDAAVEWRHMIASNNKLFKSYNITKNNTYIWAPEKAGLLLPKYARKPTDKMPAVTFITEDSGEPRELLSRFDFTFNMHFFELNSYRMEFDVDTFAKLGSVVNSDRKPTMKQFARALRFMNQGFKIDSESFCRFTNRLVNGNYQPAVDFNIFNELEHGSSSGEPAIIESLKGRSCNSYNEEGYFNIQMGNETLASEPNPNSPRWRTASEEEQRYTIVQPSPGYPPAPSGDAYVQYYGSTPTGSGTLNSAVNTIGGTGNGVSLGGSIGASITSTLAPDPNYINRARQLALATEHARQEQEARTAFTNDANQYYTSPAIDPSRWAIRNIPAVPPNTTRVNEQMLQAARDQLFAWDASNRPGSITVIDEAHPEILPDSNNT